MPGPGETTPPDDPPGPQLLEGIAEEIRRRRFRAGLWRVARWAIAVVLTLVALFLGFVPVIPGYPLFFVALFLVAPDLPPARRLLTWLQRRLPKVRRRIPKRWRRTRRDRP